MREHQAQVDGEQQRPAHVAEAQPLGSVRVPGYPLVAAYNLGNAAGPSTYRITIHFPEAGTYPYELDYFQCCGSQLSLALSTATFNPSSALSVYTGYADGLRPGGSVFPFPWQGSPNVVYVGGGCCDNGAMRFDNNTGDPITFEHVTSTSAVRTTTSGRRTS